MQLSPRQTKIVYTSLRRRRRRYHRVTCALLSAASAPAYLRNPASVGRVVARAARSKLQFNKRENGTYFGLLAKIGLLLLPLFVPLARPTFFLAPVHRNENIISYVRRWLYSLWRIYKICGAVEIFRCSDMSQKLYENKFYIKRSKNNYYSVVDTMILVIVLFTKTKKKLIINRFNFVFWRFWILK